MINMRKKLHINLKMNIKSTLLFIPLFFVFACKKDEAVSPEKTLFNRLSSGNGIWEVESVEYRTYKTDGSFVVDSVRNPDLQYIFYVKSYIVGGVSIDINSVTLARPNSFGFTYDVWAEEERVIFHQSNISFDYVFSVKENKPNKQVWVNNGTYPTTIYLSLKRCKSCQAYYSESLTETGL
jgi:hypothetical protein